MSRMVRASRYSGFIFDYGGVLAYHQTAADQARMAALAGIPKEVFSELYWSARPAYDKGLISRVEYWNGIAKSAGAAIQPDLVDKLTDLDNLSWMQFDREMWEWVEQLRAAGKRVAMLSNMPRDLGEALRAKTQKLDRFDNVTLSYEVHAVKPERAIYEHCLEALGTSPHETLFLDDRQENVEGARAVGIHAIQFTSCDEALRACS